jgi:hypothetical protein
LALDEGGTRHTNSSRRRSLSPMIKDVVANLFDLIDNATVQGTCRFNTWAT